MAGITIFLMLVCIIVVIGVGIAVWSTFLANLRDQEKTAVRAGETDETGISETSN